MFPNRLPRGVGVRGLGAAGLAGALALTGCVSAAATTSAANAPAPATTAGAHGNSHIMLYSINSDGPGFRAIVTGAVGDYGPAVTVYPDGRVDPTHAHEMELRLTRGSFRLSITNIGGKFVRAASHEPIYPRTCSTFLKVSAPTPIVPGSGTGSYRGIGGSFRMTITADEVHGKPCHRVLTFAWQALVVAGPGNITLGTGG